MGHRGGITTVNCRRGRCKTNHHEGGGGLSGAHCHWSGFRQRFCTPAAEVTVARAFLSCSFSCFGARSRSNGRRGQRGHVGNPFQCRRMGWKLMRSLNRSLLSIVCVDFEARATCQADAGKYHQPGHQVGELRVDCNPAVRPRKVAESSVRQASLAEFCLGWMGLEVEPAWRSRIAFRAKSCMGVAS